MWPLPLAPCFFGSVAAQLFQARARGCVLYVSLGLHVYRYNISMRILPTMENQMKEKMEHEVEPGDTKGLYRDPSIQIIPALGPSVYK